MPNTIFNNNILVASAAVLAGVFTYIYYKKIMGGGNSKPQKLGPTTLVDRNTKIPLKLIKRTELNHDTRIFRFGLPSEQHVLGLPVGKHISLSVKIDGKLVVRSYTPVSSDNDQGYVDLIIKVYFPNVHPKFPEGGKMTMHLENMKIGDSIDFVGPKGFIEYESTGKMTIQEDKKFDGPITRKFVRKIGMIAGGSGITPMLAIARQILSVEEDNTQIHLLYANQTEADILCREEIEEMKAKHPDQVHVWYTLDRPGADWKGFTGFINQEMLEASMPAYGIPTPGTSPQVLICGPPPMIKFAVLPNLEKMGWEPEHIYTF